MPCRKGRLHIVTYRIIDEGLRAGAGIDRIGLEDDAEIPSLPAGTCCASIAVHRGAMSHLP